jgi:acyl carrier protein
VKNGEVQQHVLQFVLKRFPLARKRNANESCELLESGIIDSLGILDLVSMLVRDFAIAVEDDELTPENFHSVAGIANFVDSKRARK